MLGLAVVSVGFGWDGPSYRSRRWTGFTAGDRGTLLGAASGIGWDHRGHSNFPDSFHLKLCRILQFAARLDLLDRQSWLRHQQVDLPAKITRLHQIRNHQEGSRHAG